MTAAARTAVLRHFRWEGAHADVWRIFADAEGLQAVVDGLADPWRGSGVTHVIGIESRGFLLGGACAVALGVGFVAIRKEHGLLPGSNKVTARSDADYRGNRPVLRMQRVVGATDRVLLVDDWAERGSQARAAAQLVGACGAVFLGMSIIVDQLEAGVRAGLGRVTSIVTADELGDSAFA
ncbi:phosphoribosyltransferase [Pseudonocardia kunmingensis]|uniref:Adenine phosphoribosyltransferase n=1 Tax=Pseudonocardia kunmingensis TaxID=630975 RepID=A0A543D9B9_9PSEU|nr:phosphoribosyltransferase [Pseudonocardia kunmingensis]TQM05885.1 adenine phosphoribosyltransferase [Pseudonocardia kunmingensis]